MNNLKFKMKILVACEESQEVCKAFREKGHEAYSCDIEPCSGGHPEWHIQTDALELLKMGRWWRRTFCCDRCTLGGIDAAERQDAVRYLTGNEKDFASVREMKDFILNELEV